MRNKQHVSPWLISLDIDGTTLRPDGTIRADIAVSILDPRSRDELPVVHEPRSVFGSTCSYYLKRDAKIGPP